MNTGRRYRVRGFDSQASRFPFVNTIHSVVGFASENNRNLAYGNGAAATQ